MSKDVSLPQTTPFAESHRITRTTVANWTRTIHNPNETSLSGKLDSNEFGNWCDDELPCALGFAFCIQIPNSKFQIPSSKHSLSVFDDEHCSQRDDWSYRAEHWDQQSVSWCRSCRRSRCRIPHAPDYAGLSFTLLFSVFFNHFCSVCWPIFCSNFRRQLSACAIPREPLWRQMMSMLHSTWRMLK